MSLSSTAPAVPTWRIAVDRRVVASTLLAAAWLTYVVASSQVAFLVAAAASATLAFWLGRERHPALAALLLVQVAVIGTEVSGDLAAGRAPLGTLHLIDITLAAGAAGTARREWLARPRVGATLVVLAALLGYAIVSWALNGHPFDPILRADVRLVGVAALAAVALRSVRPASAPQVAGWLAAITLATVTKAMVLFAIGYWTIGTKDRVQAASSGSGEHLRVILVGGDSLMIVAAACLVACLPTLHGRVRGLAATAAFAALIGLLLSGTRSSLLVAVGLLVLSGAHALAGRRPRLTGRVVAVAVVLAAVLAAGAYATGTAERFMTPDAPATGLDFREDEVRSFLDLPVSDLVFGQGMGGRFIGKSSLGQPVETGWSHNVLVWLVLKTGVVGLLAWVALLVLGVRGAVRARRAAAGDAAASALVACGVLAVTGVLVMSLTLGRVMLPEGALLLVLGCLLVTGATAREAGR